MPFQVRIVCLVAGLISIVGCATLFMLEVCPWHFFLNCHTLRIYTISYTYVELLAAVVVCWQEVNLAKFVHWKNIHRKMFTKLDRNEDAISARNILDQERYYIMTLFQGLVPICEFLFLSLSLCMLKLVLPGPNSQKKHCSKFHSKIAYF